MKSGIKYYSLDECSTQELVFNKLDLLEEDRKIDYEFVESELIKIKDLSLTSKESKDLTQFLRQHDVLEDKDYEDENDYEDEDEDEDDYGYDEY